MQNTTLCLEETECSDASFCKYPLCNWKSANIYIYIYLSAFGKTWPLGSRLAPGAAQLQASPVSEKVGGLPPWSVQLDSPGTALNSAWVDQALGSKLVG